MKCTTTIFYLLLLYVLFVLIFRAVVFLHPRQGWNHRYRNEAGHSSPGEPQASRSRKESSGPVTRQTMNNTIPSSSKTSDRLSATVSTDPSQFTAVAQWAAMINSSVLRRKELPGWGTGSGNYSWMVNASSQHPEEVRHVVFVKVHKAASTTLFNVFIRFAHSRRLNVMFPDQGNLLSQVSPGLRPLLPHPPSPPFLFDILCHHVIFNRSLLQPAFPPDTKYVAIVREPLRHLRSAFHYFRFFFSRKYLRSASSFEEFLQNHSMLEPESAYRSVTNNRMSIDLGLDPRHLEDAGYISTFLRHLDEVFDLVLIADRFDESVLLLKRRLHWTLKDIVCKPLNIYGRNASSDKISPEALEKFQQFQVYDRAVYQHFLKVFDQKVAEEGPDFREELLHFIGIQNRIKQFCSNGNMSAFELVMPRSKWDEEFTLHYWECNVLSAREGRLDAWAKAVQLARLKDWKV